MDKRVPADVTRFAFVTASYGPDFERCRLLCETVDQHVAGMAHHYILVEGSDLARFRALESARRTVVDERDLLPSWLHSFRDPTSLWRRRIWLSLRTRALRGWHVQQLRRIAIAAHAGEEVFVYCDSDVAFLRAFDCSTLLRDGDTRLFRRDFALADSALADQRVWARNAGRSLGIPDAQEPVHDYIATLIAWRRDAVLGMCRTMEEVHARHWVEAVAASRRFSECMLYGRYVDEVLGGTGHFADATELCRIYWDGPEPDDVAFRQFLGQMSEEQVAIGMQSFIGTDIERIRRLIGEPATAA